MTIKFYLGNARKRSGKSLILLKTWDIKTGNNLPFTFSINEQIEPEHWQDGKVKKSFKQATWLNALLDKYRAKALDFIRMTQVDKERPPTADELKAFLSDFKNKLQGKTDDRAANNNVLAVWDMVIEELKRKAKPGHRATWEHYQSTKKEFAKFLKDTRRSAEWTAMDADCFAAWQDYLFDKGDNQNTVTGKWKRFKRVLNTAKDLGLYEGEQHRRRALSMSFQKADEVFFTVDELMKIYSLDLSYTTLEETKDLFLLDAFAAGFRFGDLSALAQSKIINLNQRTALKLHTGKTDTAVVTPGSWYLSEFLEKYAGRFPKKKTNQVFNRNLKKICKLAGLTEPTTLRKNIAGKNTDVTKPKYMWASQYTARYSFATNLLLAGVDIKTISTLLGHSKVTTTETYIKAKQMETALNISSHDFFTKKPILKTATK